MLEAKIHRLSPETRKRCQQIIAEQNSNLQQNSWVYIARVPIAKVLGDGQFEYLGSLQDNRSLNVSSESDLRTILLGLKIISSIDDDITEYLYNSSQQHDLSPPPRRINCYF